MKNLLAHVRAALHHRTPAVGRGADPRVHACSSVHSTCCGWASRLAVLIAISAVLTVRGRRLTGWIAATVRVATPARRRPDAAVGARRRRDSDAGRPRGGALAGRPPGVGDRTGSAAVHADGDRRPARHSPMTSSTPRLVEQLHRPRTVPIWRPTSSRRATASARPRRRASSRSTSRWSARTPRRRTDARGSCCARCPRRRASRRCDAKPGSRGWPATWWPRPPASQISWPATESTRGAAAASTTSTAPPRSASSARPGRSIKGRSTFTAAYTAPGGPDVWWSARADHTITRVRIVPVSAPTTTVLLTTLANPSTPRGFSCLFGGQRAALHGREPGHRPALRAANRLGGRAGRRDRRPVPGVHAVRRRRRQHQPGRRAAVHAVRGAVGRRRRRHHPGAAVPASSPASSTPASGRWPRWCGRTPRPTWGRIPGSAESCCGTTSSTLRGIVSCPSG